MLVPTLISACIVATGELTAILMNKILDLLSTMTNQFQKVSLKPPTHGEKLQAPVPITKEVPTSITFGIRNPMKPIRSEPRHSEIDGSKFQSSTLRVRPFESAGGGFNWKKAKTRNII
uniref:Uncharacterized protein n=1 Tax=Cacopsylla melanoneura TaxID=428564 RepID=A0A8D8YIX3_9HEMI